MFARSRLDISISSHGHGSLSRFLCSTHKPSTRLSRLRLRAITGTTPENTLLGNLRQRTFQTYAPRQADNSSKNEQTPPKGKLLNKLKLPDTLRENIYTIPNLLTVSRILACPLLGYFIVQGNYVYATSLLAYAGLTDLVDGWMARRFNMSSVLGTILDPAADKALMTTLTVTLAMKSLIPVPLAVIILGRDVLLSLSAFYIRYTSLPQPKTWSRYWDFSIPSAEVRPTTISKYNTALQLLLMGVTTVSPILPVNLSVALQGLQYLVGATTIWSGASYLFTKDAVRIVQQPRQPPPPPVS